MRKISARKIRRGVPLVPDNIVQGFEPKLLHGEPDRIDYVRGAGNPYRAVRFQDALARFQPVEYELMVFLDSFRFVPFPLVDRNHLAGMAGYPAVGEKVGRVGENHIDGVFRALIQDFNTVTLQQAGRLFSVFIKNRKRFLPAVFFCFFGCMKGG